MAETVEATCRLDHHPLPYKWRTAAPGRFYTVRYEIIR